MHRFFFINAVIGGVGLTLSADAADKVDFAHQIVPLIRQHCGKCHLGDKLKGGLSFNTREDLLRGGENGKVVIPGDSAKSRFLQLIVTKDEDDRMPPNGDPLSEKEVNLVKAWIEAGIPWEPGFAFDKPAYEPPLKPRRPALPAAVAGRTNAVDRIIDHYLANRKLALPAPLTDEAFTRRVYLDLIGILPTPDELDNFARDTRPDKRGLLIGNLLGRDVTYAEHWLTFWNDLLRNDYSGTGFITGGRKQITEWLYRSLVDNKPFDQFTRELIAPAPEAEGFIKGIQWRGNVNASQTLEIQFAQNISQVFLGINLKCASCHDSFIDRWKLDEAYNLAAIFGANKIEIHRCDKPTGRFAQPGWLFPELGNVDPKTPPAERLKQLASLMTHPENGRFTRTIVNRIWHRMMGRGIIHPVDAMQMEPWNADLIDYLAVHLAENKFDLKATISLIATSRTYQSQAVPQKSEPDAERFVFRGPTTRRMTAEQFLDCIWQITDSGPSVPDASVFRGKTSAEAGRETPVSGKWIWSTADGSESVPKAGERITLRKIVKFDARPTLATAVITADNEYTVYINGRKIAADDFWPTVEVIPLEGALNAGNNTIMVVTRNAGEGPNAAALFFEARLKHPNGTETVIASDETWQWSKSIPDARGRFKAAPKDWKPAVPVTNQSFLPGKVRRAIMGSLAQIDSAENHFVRASLVKLDFLMRSLGRPMRDQVVTTRPDELTTLQAIDLQNGQILSDMIERGAKNVAAKKHATPEKLVDWLYRHALSRAPSSAETTIALEILNETPGAKGIEDLLWAVFMLPEFQLIR